MIRSLFSVGLIILLNIHTEKMYLMTLAMKFYSPTNNQLWSFISTADLNNDGKEDIFIGGAHTGCKNIFI